MEINSFIVLDWLQDYHCIPACVTVDIHTDYFVDSRKVAVELNNLFKGS